MPGEQTVLHKILGLICADYGIAPVSNSDTTFTSVMFTLLQSLVDHIQLILVYVGASESEVNVVRKFGLLCGGL